MEVIDALTAVKDVANLTDIQILEVVRRYALQIIESTEQEKLLKSKT